MNTFENTTGSDTHDHDDFNDLSIKAQVFSFIDATNLAIDSYVQFNQKFLYELEALRKKGESIISYLKKNAQNVFETKCQALLDVLIDSFPMSTMNSELSEDLAENLIENESNYEIAMENDTNSNKKSDDSSILETLQNAQNNSENDFLFTEELFAESINSIYQDSLQLENRIDQIMPCETVPEELSPAKDCETITLPEHENLIESTKEISRVEPERFCSIEKVESQITYPPNVSIPIEIANEIVSISENPDDSSRELIENEPIEETYQDIVILEAQCLNETTEPTNTNLFHAQNLYNLIKPCKVVLERLQTNSDGKIILQPSKYLKKKKVTMF